VTSLGDVLVEECLAVERALSDLHESAFDRLTNCPPWSLKDLIVHTWQTLQLPPSFRSSSAAPATASDWYRRSERETLEYRTQNVDRARAAAERFADGPACVAALVAAALEVRHRLASMDDAAVIAHPAVGAIRLNDFVVTRVISVAVHGVDIAISTGMSPFTTTEALGVTCSVLEDLLEASAAELGWTKLELLLWGTGRQPVPHGRASYELEQRLPAIS
jgi:uncharacterized protein (TIGR03083 family)